MDRKKTNYAIGLDIGTSSVGWCIIDEQYNILKKGNKHLWGIRLFETAQTAQKRRNYRSQRRRYKRRRYNRRKERIRLLRNIMNDSVLEKDPDFFIKLSEISFLDEEDKKSVLNEKYHGNYILFQDENFNDKTYYQQFPTIYHLRKYLCVSKEKADPRLIYLALHHIVKYRGNFLYEDQEFSLDKINDMHCLKNTINQILKINHFSLIDDQIANQLEEQLKQNNSRKFKVEQCLKILNRKGIEKTVLKNILNSFVGLKFNVSKIFNDDTLKIENNGKQKDIEFNFGLTDYEEFSSQFLDISVEYLDCIGKMKEVYSLLILDNMLNISDVSSSDALLSSAMIKRYESHKKDLYVLKKVIRENYGLDTYKKVFRDENVKNNYYSYIHHPKDTSSDDFYGFLNKILTGKANEKEIIDNINREQFMLKQNSRSNNNIPYQLHLLEMKKIIENQEKYYPYLKQRKNDILKIVTFRIPYYYGPFTSNKFGWLVKQQGMENERILPWNHEKVVDIDHTASQFVSRLTNYCTYLLDEKVMPKKSLTCQMFEVLNELNKMRVEGEFLSVEVKDQIISEIFMKKKKVTEKDLLLFFKKYNVYLNNDNLDIKGYQKDKEFSTTLSSWIDFVKIFGIIDENNYQQIEKIIKDITIFKEKNILKRKLKKDYVLDDDIIDKIAKLNYTGWSRLSYKLIDGIHCDNRFGSSATILDVMKSSNLNLMEIINNRKLGYQQEIEKYNSKFEIKNNEEDIVDYLACSPAVKKGIRQSLKVIDELKKYMKHAPSDIYIEFAREEKKKVRTVSQVKKLQMIYNDLKIQNEQDQKVMMQLNAKDNQTQLDNDRLYLYFEQKGRCMYSGKTLDIDKLNLYHVDHIIPRTLISDDSLDNKVLVISDENERKLDDLVIPSKIRKKQSDYWRELKNNKLISEKKYNKLIRTEFNDNQLERFINRQLVETRQIIKNLANILQNYYMDTQIHPIRANLTTEFRKKYGVYKNRNVNDFHHAHDAYIVSIIGQYINHRFPHLQAKYVYGDYIKKAKKETNSHEKSGFIINSMNYDQIDEYTGEVIWKKDNIGRIKKYFDYKDVYVTKKLEDSEGEFYNETIYSPHDTKNIPSFPINKYRADVQKYGGYSGVQSCIYAIEGKRNKKVIRKIVGLPLVYETKNNEFKIKYLEKQEKLSGVKVIKKIRKNQLIEIDEGLYYITSPHELANARQLILSKQQQAFVYKINQAMKNNDYGDIDREKMNEFYNFLIDKINKLYPKYHNIAQKMINLKETYEFLSIEEKSDVINQILITLSSGSRNGHIKYDDFSIGDRLGRLSKQNILLDNTVFINQSITGIYCKKRKI